LESVVFACACPGFGLVAGRSGVTGAERSRGCVVVEVVAVVVPVGRSSIGATGGSCSELRATVTNAAPTARLPISSPRKNRFIHPDRLRAG
jgi:hypothetical protein